MVPITHESGPSRGILVVQVTYKKKSLSVIVKFLKADILYIIVIIIIIIMTIIISMVNTGLKVAQKCLNHLQTTVIH